jgi:hypothetical protein
MSGIAGSMGEVGNALESMLKGSRIAKWAEQDVMKMPLS